MNSPHASLGNCALSTLLWLVVSVFTVTAQAIAQCQYDVTIIQAPECPPFGFPPTIGLGLSEQGHVVGRHLDCEFIDDEAFVWTPETGLVTLPLPPATIRKVAFDIEGSLIVGRFDVLGDGLGDLGFVYDHKTGALTNLGTLPGGNFSEALAIDQGIVVGNWGNFIIGPIHGFIWQDAVMTDLGPILGTPRSRTFDIKNGAVTGWMGSSTLSDAHAYILEDGVVTELPPIPEGFTSQGQAINIHRDVAGRGLLVDRGTGQTVRHALLFSDSRMTDLGVLPGMNWSLARDLNDMRTVVGTSSLSNQNHTAFVWHQGLMSALNDLIPPDLGVNVTNAWAINNAGLITATAGSPDGAVTVLLTPVDAPMGDLTGDCRVGILDLLSLLAAWGPCDECSADLDKDGYVGIVDLLILLENWG